MITGTSHFTSRDAAIWYYRQCDPAARRTEIAEQVDRKIADGEIHIGPPTCDTRVVTRGGEREFIPSSRCESLQIGHAGEWGRGLARFFIYFLDMRSSLD